MVDTPTDADKETIEVLNDLIATCSDGLDGFRMAAEAVKSSDAKALFQSRALMIEVSEIELKEAVRQLGGSPAEHGHTVASLHRGWMNLKAAVTGQNDDAIISEVIRGEEAAVEHYRNAVCKLLPVDVGAFVETQLHGAEQNLERVRNLSINERMDGPIPSAPRPADLRPTL
jgi:uncharacterized protein (TIGR02284 family)